MERSYRNGVDWRDLCEQASKEQDPEKLIEIGYSGEGEQPFRREGEQHSGVKVNSSRSEATLAG